MVRIDRSALVNYSAQQMFDLVNDIESYPQFMQGCTAARVIESSDNELIGELTLSRGGFKQTLVTRNTLEYGREMKMALIDGKFSAFSATWHFNPLAEDACKVSLSMEFEFALGLMDYTLERLFSSSANNLVDAVVNRAKLVYG